MKVLCMLTVLVVACQALPRSRFNSHYDDDDDDYFSETGFVLTPSDREERDLSFDFPQLEDDESLDYGNYDHTRQERDGGAHGRHGRRGQRQGRNNRRQQQQRREEEVVEERQGRQSGDVGVALGVLNNPPREDGAYNFK